MQQASLRGLPGVAVGAAVSRHSFAQARPSPRCLVRLSFDLRHRKTSAGSRRHLPFSQRRSRFRWTLPAPRLAAKAVELFGATLAAREPQQTIETLVNLLQDDISSADNDVRIAIADLVQAYKNNPEEGARIARSIRALLGKL